MRVTVIDSGLGGITFADNIKKNFIDLEVSLLIDKEGFPYGHKEIDWLKERLESLVNNSKTNVIIIACNTLSSLIFYYDLKFKKTVVDVITPTIYFLKRNNYQNICILATKNTIKMDIYNKLVDKKITYIDSTELISDLEYKIDFKTNLNDIIKLIDKNSDLVILGCTHLIAIKEEFRKTLNMEVLSQDEIFFQI